MIKSKRKKQASSAAKEGQFPTNQYRVTTIIQAPTPMDAGALVEGRVVEISEMHPSQVPQEYEQEQPKAIGFDIGGK